MKKRIELVPVAVAIRLLAFVASVFCASATACAQASVDTYQYDVHGRLIQTQAGTGAKTNYTYDPADNRAAVATQRQLDSIPGSQETWEAEALPHAVGSAGYAGWGAGVTDPNGAMVYGPYSNGVPVGAHTAVWRMLIDSNTNPSTDTVVMLDVNDSEANQVLASRTLTWNSFAAALAYQIFELNFKVDPSRAGHHFEFRVWFYSQAYINVDKVAFY